MAIPEGYIANFNTLTKAFKNKNVALVETSDKATGKKVYVICAVQRDGEMIEIVPFAKLFDGNPYDELVPPLEDAENDGINLTTH